MEKLTQDEMQDLNDFASMTPEQAQRVFSDPEAAAYAQELQRKYTKSGIAERGQKLDASKEDSNVVSAADRVLVLNTANSAQDAVAYLQKKYPNAFVVANEAGDIFIKGEKDSEFKPLDSSKVTAKDALDIVPDIPGALIQTPLTAAEALFPPSKLVTAGIQGGVAGLEDLARQGVGRAMGVNKDVSQAQALTAAGLGATLGVGMKAIPRNQAMKLAQSGVMTDQLKKLGYDVTQFSTDELADIIQRETQGILSKGAGLLSRASEMGIEKAVGLPKGSAREYISRWARGEAKSVPPVPREIDLTTEGGKATLDAIQDAGGKIMTPVRRAVDDIRAEYSTAERAYKRTPFSTAKISETMQNLISGIKDDMRFAKNKKVYKEDLRVAKKINKMFKSGTMSLAELKRLKDEFSEKVQKYSLSPEKKRSSTSLIYKEAVQQVDNLINESVPGRRDLNEQFKAALDRMGISKAAVEKIYEERTQLNPANIMKAAMDTDNIGTDQFKRAIQDAIQSTKYGQPTKAAMSRNVRSGLQELRDIAIQNPKLAQELNYAATNSAPVQTMLNKFTSDLALNAAAPLARKTAKTLAVINPDVELQGPIRTLVNQANKGATKQSGMELLRSMMGQLESREPEQFDMEQEAVLRKLRGE